ncbi:MAG: hypothetical protein M3R38_21455 [Actinomycetota bacterium]|nr:hypothetical protein [Actinomycetota bacterium]
MDEKKREPMRWMKPIYAVMVPNLFTGGYHVDDPVYEDRAEAQKRAEDLTFMARHADSDLPACYVKCLAMTPKAEQEERTRQ